MAAAAGDVLPVGAGSATGAFKICQHLAVDGSPAKVSVDQYPDTQRFLQVLEQLGGDVGAASDLPEWQAARSLFRWEDDIFVSRAPGRLDVMGGIADYSGSLVLQMPLAEACHVAVQRHPAASSDGDKQPAMLRIVSFGADASHRGPALTMELSELMPDGTSLGYAEARALFSRDPSLSWAAYVAGALVVLMRECAARFEDGLSILVSSDVPEGKGVSSSAAVEVAAMSALAGAHGIRLDGRTLALLCQKVENHVVGAPCGVMDQMASALGHRSQLLALRCQPAEVQGTVPIPPHLQFWGVDSGIRHSVGGSDYGHVRVGTFMGLRIISQLAHEAGGGAGDGKVTPLGHGYLANVNPSQFMQRYEERLPETLGGADFLRQYSSHWDTATIIDESQAYAVRVPAGHPVHENFRVHVFQQVLAGPAEGGAEQMELLGELMRQSHASYSRCGLGSDGTDRLVDLTQEEHEAAAARGEQPALYGAKITGGGCGGTVCILGVAGPRGEAALQRVVQRYTEESGYAPKVFRGSSSGAAEFGHLRLVRQELV